jgi:hypothetical protein
MPRPTKLTAELQDRLIRAIRAGAHSEPAARAAGIAPSTYYRWMARGQVESTGLYHELHEAVRQAEAEAEVRAVAVISRAMSDDWRAAVGFLERRFPSRWRRHQTTELLSKPAEQEELDLSRLSDEQLKQLEELHKLAAKSHPDRS